MAIVQLLICLKTLSIASAISWQLSTRPAIFYHNVNLTCSLSTPQSCCNEYPRIWSSGKDYELLILNGNSVNESKYEEILYENNNSSILIIKQFDEKDVDILYHCSYGFYSASKMLKLNQTDFLYLPDDLTAAMPHVKTEASWVWEINKHVDRIYPKPICFATDNGHDISDNLTIASDRNGKFFSANITLVYNVRKSCGYTILIECMVGQSNVTIFEAVPFCHHEKGKFKVEIIIIVTVTVMVTIVLSALLYIILRKRLINKRGRGLSESTVEMKTLRKKQNTRSASLEDKFIG